MSTTEQKPAEFEIREKVREGYAAIAEGAEKRSSCGPTSSCCGPSGESEAAALASSFGYSAEELKALPEGANLGLSCGNPTAIASLQPGEVVVDLGSGGGFDIFIAGRKVGAEGLAIGVDMTPEMIARARRNALVYTERTGLRNVDFRLGEIEHLPLGDESVDVVVSNCVLNLSPNKRQVWSEIARVLRPGGRVAVSDIALYKPLPENVRTMAEALIGCMAGAELIEKTRRIMTEAGFTHLELTPRPEYIGTLASMDDALYRRISEALPAGSKVEDYVTSLSISAKKSGGCCCGC